MIPLNQLRPLFDTHLAAALHRDKQVGFNAYMLGCQIWDDYADKTLRTVQECEFDKQLHDSRFWSSLLVGCACSGTDLRVSQRIFDMFVRTLHQESGLPVQAFADLVLPDDGNKELVQMLEHLDEILKEEVH